MARVARKTGMELVWHIAGRAWAHPSCARLRGGLVAALGVAVAVSFATYNAGDPSLNAATGIAPTNALGGPGAVLADLGVQSLGLAAGVAAPGPPPAWPLARGLGGFWGDALLGALGHVFAFAHLPWASGLAALFLSPL